MLKNTSIYLIGMMGAGKSTVGPRLARRLDYQFFDTDALITKVTGQTIPQLFAQGESVFRGLETQVLGQLAPYARLVVGVGGGGVLASGNWAFLHTGIVVWLDVPFAQLWERVQHDPNRPLVQGEEHFQALLAQREHLYAQADVRVEAGGAPELVCDQILANIAARIAQDRDYIDQFIGR